MVTHVFSAIAFLKDQVPGSFVVRDSNSFPGAFGLALKVAHIPPNVPTKGGNIKENYKSYYVLLFLSFSLKSMTFFLNLVLVYSKLYWNEWENIDLVTFLCNVFNCSLMHFKHIM
jgi:hypothetical protein